MLICDPASVFAKIPEDALAVRMEDMRPIPVDENSRLVVFIISIASDMRPLLNHENSCAKTLSIFPCNDRAGKAATHHDCIVVRDDSFVVIYIVDAHDRVPFFSTYEHERTLSRSDSLDSLLYKTCLPTFK